MSFSLPKSPEPYRAPVFDEAAFKALIDAAPDRFPVAAPSPIRSTRKAAQWTGAICRAYGYASDRIRDPGQRAELDALYEKTLAAGPDFAKVRRNADFSPAPIVVYSKEAAAEIMRQARQIERESFATRAKGEHGGALGRMALQLLEWLCYVLWPKACFGMVPSLAHIATSSRMSRATVVEAMKPLEAFGFLTIQRRRQRVPTPLGVKVVQATSAYTLGLAKGLGVLALAAFGKKPQTAANRGEQRSEFRRSPAIRDDLYSAEGMWKTLNLKPSFEPLLT